MAVEQHLITTIIKFIIVLLISTLVIYLVTSITRHRRSIKLALFTAIIGLIVYVIVHFWFENSFLSAVLAGIAWLLAVKTIYHMGWLKALIIATSIWTITIISLEYSDRYGLI